MATQGIDSSCSDSSQALNQYYQTIHKCHKHDHEKNKDKNKTQDTQSGNNKNSLGGTKVDIYV